MNISLNKVAGIVGGKVFGDESLEIRGIVSFEEAQEGDITFIAHRKYLKKIDTSGASAFILSEELSISRPSIKVKNPYLAFAKLLEYFHPSRKEDGRIDEKAVIGEGVTLGSSVTVYPNVFIGKNVVIGDNTVIFPGVSIGNDCKIGRNSILFANVSLYDRITVGNKVRIHSGAVIGSDGFGYTLDEEGRYFKIPQVGTVVLEDDVEIGANVCIDRATLGKTTIKRGVKIDNLVQLAHNVTIGDDTVIASQTGISGSCTIGKRVIMAGQVGLADHVNIGDHSILVAQAGVAKDLKSGVYSGSPAVDHSLWKRMQAALLTLPTLARRVKRLEKKEKENAG